METAKKLKLKSSRFYEKEMSSKTVELIEEIKLKDRSHLRLKEWYKRNHFDKSMKDIRKQYEKYFTIARVDGRTFTAEQFVKQFEIPDIPCIISSSNEEWNVEKYWTFEKLYQLYKETSFKIGEDDKGKKLRLPFKYFLEYLVYNKDDSPLYLFESSIEDLKEGGKDLINRFKPHKYFQEDFFSLVGEKHRPPYRWFLVGYSYPNSRPKRSGTTVHIDPLWTSAWNTSLQGHKLWVLFPPDIPKCVVKAKGLAARKLIDPEDLDESIDYFLYALPKLIEQEGAENLKIVMCVQGPGDTIFVPGGWWHAVLNLDNTVAITQNFMSINNFDKIWRSVRKERPKFSQRLLKAFQEQRGDLYDRALKLDEIEKNEFRVVQGNPLSTDSSSGSSSSSSSSDSSSSSGSDD